MKKNLVVSISGGRSSVLMAFHVSVSKKYRDFNKVFVFANTGMERVETIMFLKDMVKFWKIDLVLLEGVFSLEKGVGVRYKIVDFNNLSMDCKPFEDSIAHLNKLKWTGVPNHEIPYCAGYLKKRVIEKFAKDFFNGSDFITAIGYRKEDMPERVTFSELKADSSKICPLLTDFSEPLGVAFLDIFYEGSEVFLNIEAGLDNCELCYKKSDRDLVKALRKGVRSSSLDFVKRMENQYGNTFYRGLRKIEDFEKLASGSLQLELFSDSSFGKCNCGL